MARGTESNAEQSRAAEAGTRRNGEDRLVNPEQANDAGKDKRADKDKSKTDRSARKSRRARILEEAQAEEAEGAAAGQERDVQAGDQEASGRKSRRKNRDANDQVGENLGEDANIRDPAEIASNGSGSKSSQRSALRDIARRGQVPNEDVPSLPEMWQMVKDMMSQVAEIGRIMAFMAHSQEPVQEAVAPSVQEVARPASAPEERETGLQRAHASRGKADYLTVLEHVARLGTKSFKGGADPIAADEWRCRLIRNFRSTRCPFDYQKDIAVHFLEGDAHNWWLAVEKRYGERVNSFSAFEEEFNRKYFPVEAKDRLENEFLNLTQGQLTVREYEEKFSRLRRYVGEHDAEELQVRRFLKGLRTDIMIPCSVCTFGTVAELVEKAVLIEEGLARKDRVTRHEERRGSGSASRKRKHEETSRSSDRPSCAICGKGHSGQCRQSSQGMSATFVDRRTCYRCKKPGHVAKDCPELESGSRGQYTDRGGQESSARKPAGTPRVYELAKDPGTSGQYEAITGKKPVEA